jgi:MFS family permease
MLPVVAGLLIAGPISGILSDRFGARPFATAGPLLAGVSFFLLARLPVDFPYAEFALLLALNGIGMGLFISPNRAAVMNSLPVQHRGAGGGMNQTFQNSAQVLSIGIFFTLMIIGLSSTLPQAMSSGLEAHGVAASTAHTIAHLPPVSILFAAFLGYNPIEHLLGPHVLGTLSAVNHSALTGRAFFPHLISAPFREGLDAAFLFAIIACLIAAAASLLRGGTYHYEEPPGRTPVLSDGLESGAGASRITRAPTREEQHAG